MQIQRSGISHCFVPWGGQDVILCLQKLQLRRGKRELWISDFHRGKSPQWGKLFLALKKALGTGVMSPVSLRTMEVSDTDKWQLKINVLRLTSNQNSSANPEDWRLFEMELGFACLWCIPCSYAVSEVIFPRTHLFSDLPLSAYTNTHTGLEQENELEFKPKSCFDSSPNKLSLWIWITPPPPLFTRCNIFCLNNKQKVLEVNETSDDMKGRAQQFNMLGETSMNSSLLRDNRQLHDFSSGPAANSRPDPCCEAFLH